MQGAGLVCKVEIDNSNKTSGQKKNYIYIVDSTGEKKWVRPGMVVDASAYKNKFEDEEKKSGGKPYMLGGDDDASESNGDEPLEKPPVAKDAMVEALQTTAIDALKRHVHGPLGQLRRWQAARDAAALLADPSAEKADERAALVESLGKTLEAAWTKYEKHRKKYPDLYLEEESDEEEDDYRDVPIDHVKMADWIKDKFISKIQKCVAKKADISWIEAMPSKKIRSADFTKALLDASGEFQVQQQSLRLAGVVAPPLPTTSNAGTSLVYLDSYDPNLITDEMVEDSHALVRDGTLVPAVARGGFNRGIGTGNALRFIGVPGPGFYNRFDRNAVFEYDPVEAISSSLKIDLESCFKLSEWAELEPRLVYASEIAWESLPDETRGSKYTLDKTSVKEQAKAVYRAIYVEVEKHEHEAVWKSTFRAPGLLHTG